MEQEYVNDMSIEEMIGICKEHPEELAVTIKGTDTEKLASFLARHYKDELSKEEIVALLFKYFLRNEEAGSSYEESFKTDEGLAEWFANYIFPVTEKYLVETNWHDPIFFAFLFHRYVLN